MEILLFILAGAALCIAGVNFYRISTHSHRNRCSCATRVSDLEEFTDTLATDFERDLESVWREVKALSKPKKKTTRKKSTKKTSKKMIS